MLPSSSKHVLVMGVTGTGKSTIGAALADRLGLIYIEGDALHTKANILKMSGGHPLDDDDRWPWLENCALALKEHAGAVLSCSALKRRYRDYLRAKAQPIKFDIVCLFGDQDLIAQRMSKREHFMPTSLLDSQLAAFEPPDPDENAVMINIDQKQSDIIEDLFTRLRKTA